MITDLFNILKVGKILRTNKKLYLLYIPILTIFIGATHRELFFLPGLAFMISFFFIAKLVINDDSDSREDS